MFQLLLCYLFSINDFGKYRTPGSHETQGKVLDLIYTKIEDFCLNILKK